MWKVLVIVADIIIQAHSYVMQIKCPVGSGWFSALYPE
ncbi:hypothetical protein YPPY66_3070 [Yersinia pestis PY-66]|uniref:Uncharacterized protein n=1 Tax=Yersinia pestis PY-08 TaxID=992134 RepID=A0AB72ZHL9_YERPE|nr:hypothetical protein YPC_2077 [Yersinia pestis biovar Medievalis str. Harbin 35]EDR41551.1 hypothetical protein YpE1979001_2704 [Yersinia pestis biovar Antiqua str. E1979001]EDR52646.1 hypothetical protein YpB42003004_1837 [Yersinia pestis biovar Antiqua str. B42003004]EDR65929.1 hypothetical protein YpK1973002_0315 [Yersinia pestis biovar Mediaevalis str. K1973002]EEO80147.1 hypothetical protein YPF_2963 [Yersinia pestis biovar Orientalis str. India 195]EEO84379.1 hypothetical protein YPH_